MDRIFLGKVPGGIGQCEDAAHGDREREVKRISKTFSHTPPSRRSSGITSFMKPSQANAIPPLQALKAPLEQNVSLLYLFPYGVSELQALLSPQRECREGEGRRGDKEGLWL